MNGHQVLRLLFLTLLFPGFCSHSLPGDYNGSNEAYISGKESLMEHLLTTTGGHCAESMCLTQGHNDPTLEAACSELLSLYLRFPVLGQNERILRLIIGQNGDEAMHMNQIVMGDATDQVNDPLFERSEMSQNKAEPQNAFKATKVSFGINTKKDDSEFQQEINCWDNCNDLYSGNRNAFAGCVRKYCNRWSSASVREKKSPDSKTCGEVHCQGVHNQFACLAEHCRYS